MRIYLKFLIFFSDLLITADLNVLFLLYIYNYYLLKCDKLFIKYFLFILLEFPTPETTVEAAIELFNKIFIGCILFLMLIEAMANMASPAPTLSITLDANAGQ